MTGHEAAGLLQVARAWASSDGHRLGSPDWWEAYRAYRELLREEARNAPQHLGRLQ
jgi:hypothetical protein